MEETLLEVCVDSLDSAMAAIDGGADRLELCGALVVGGLTPPVALLAQIRERSSIPIRCLMRPRYGDFLYSEGEIELMARQIPMLADQGADGFVIGCLRPNGTLDRKQMERLMAQAPGKGFTLHRAFDLTADAFAAAKEAWSMGIDTILTSGQRENCWAGRELIGQLLRETERPAVLVGAGVNAQVMEKMLSLYPVRQFHMSGKTARPSGMEFRREGVPMGLPGLDEFTVWQTDRKKIRQAAELLRKGTQIKK